MKLLDQENFYETIEGFYRFKSEVTDFSTESFRKAFGSDCAKKHRNIVYLLRSEHKVTRLKGMSDILYIGQTKDSFKSRYFRHAEHLSTTAANSLKFEHILKTYGSISIWASDYSKFGETLLKAEGQLLWWYFSNHCEYPPINYTQTKVRNNKLYI